jgi:magnesium chelatase family protein
MEVTHLHSLANPDYTQLVQIRPFRAPHHTATTRALLGGGSPLRPGEISLAHHGVLFLDELPEFSRQAVEALRQPLEDGSITLTRSSSSLRFPAKFILVATANPCPCGFYGTNQVCHCLPYAVQKYQQKLSGPMMDRVDLCVSVERMTSRQLFPDTQQEESSSAIRERVRRARLLQASRWPPGEAKLNASLSNTELRRTAEISPEAKALLDKAADRLSLSARGYMRVLKVSRTIADLANTPAIEVCHLSEALQYRQRENP